MPDAVVPLAVCVVAGGGSRPPVGRRVDEAREPGGAAGRTDRLLPKWIGPLQGTGRAGPKQYPGGENKN